MRCDNCAEIAKKRCRGEGECGLKVMIAEQIAEPGKIEKFALVMEAFHLRVETIGNDFRIVAA